VTRLRNGAASKQFLRDRRAEDKARSTVRNCRKGMVPGKLKMTSFDSFWDTPLADLLQLLQETPAGLTSAEAKQRLHLHGPNSLVQESQLATLVSFLRLFANPLVIMLLVASAISLVLGDPVGGLIIIAIVVLSVLLILLNNFLYDASQTTIPSDNVDPTLLHRPKRWQIGFIRHFMMIIGPISSIYDFLTFGLLLWVFHASTNAPLFRSAWFVESLATQTLVVFVIRTAGNPSRPGRPLLIAVIAIVTIATVLPYSSLGSLLQFTPLPLSLLGAIACLAVIYLLVVQVVKTRFYRKHALL
jgi:magnesium-transporting ATPase (P-type)